MVESASFDSFLKTQVPAIGIDLGGTKICGALVMEQGLVSDPVKISTPDTPEKILNSLVELIQILRTGRTVAGVGIATAGIVDRERGEVIGSTNNIRGWEGTPLKKIIEGRTMLPVEVENDANAAAYGESKAAQLGDRRCVIVVTLGTGIGCGIIIDGKVFHGAHWGAGECGHLKIAMDNQRLCTCGLFDCWEAFGCGAGLVNTTKELLVGVSPEQSSLAQARDSITTHTIKLAADHDDIIAQKALNIWHHHVAAGLVNLAHALDPDCFILTGGLSNLIDYRLLQEIVVDRCIPRVGEFIEVRPSKLGNDAGMIGAGQLALHAILSKKS
jgi:glucokinase